MTPTAQPRRLPLRGTAVLLGLVAGLLLFQLGAVPLLGPDEPRYSRVAVEMQRAGAWVRPTLQGQPWLEKPPLYYWLAGASFHALGETEAAARMPSVLAALLLVAATAWCGARLFGAAAGLHAGFVAGTAALVFGYGRAASMDMLLAAAMTATLALLARALVPPDRDGNGPDSPGEGETVPVTSRREEGARVLALVGAYACAGLAVLAKGPIGVLLPGLVLVGYAVAAREPRVLSRAFSVRGCIAFFGVAAPWHVLILLDQGRRFVDVFLLDHNLRRFTSTIHHHPGSPVYYLPVLLAGLVPWSGLLVPALAEVRPLRSRAQLFVVAWLVLPFAFFSAAGSKLPGYILPCVPPLALLAGRAAAGLVRDEARWNRWGRSAAGFGWLLGAVVAAAPVWLALRGDPYAPGLIPTGAWVLLATTLFWRQVGADPAGALRTLRVGAAGFLLLGTSALPPLLAARESGRDLFAPARGREVLAWGAWRTAWMAGYFYNDGQVREVEGLADVAAAAGAGRALVLCGPAERRQLAAAPGLVTHVLAEGPRENALLEVLSKGRVDLAPGDGAPGQDPDPPAH